MDTNNQTPEAPDMPNNAENQNVNQTNTAEENATQSTTQNPYSNNVQQENVQYANQQYINQQYANQQNGNQQYVNPQYGNQYANQQYGNQQYVNPQYDNQQYANQQYGNQYANQQYNSQQYVNQQYGNQQYANQQYAQNSKPPKKPLSPKQKKTIITGISIFVAVIVVVCLAAFLLSLRKEKVSLDEYVTTPEFEGYDTMGNAYNFYFDYYEFIEDYEDEIEYSKSVKKTSDTSGSLYDIYSYKKSGCSAAECLYLVYINGYIDKSSNLSNGDTVTYTFDISEEALEEIREYFNCNLIFSEEGVSFTVTGLTELEKVDIFADVEITYSGKSPVAEISSIKNTSSKEALSQIYYNASDAYELENGQTITISIDDDEVTHLAEYYGVIPIETSKEFTVEGLDAYITSLSDIPDELIEKLKEQCEDELNAHAASSFSDPETLADITYLGCYFLTPKDKDDYDDYWSDSTMLYMVYKIKVNQYNEEKAYNNITEYYTYVKFYEPVLLADGTCSVDLSDYDTASNTFNITVTGENGSSNFYYYGYEDLDSLFNKCVTANVDTYNYESTVEDVETNEAEETTEAAETTGATETTEAAEEAAENTDETEDTE